MDGWVDRWKVRCVDRQMQQMTDRIDRERMIECRLLDRKVNY